MEEDNGVLLQSMELYQYILETSVYPREPEPLRELTEATTKHPRSELATAADSGQLMALLLKLSNAKKTIEIGVFRILSSPDCSFITRRWEAIGLSREAYEEIGLPIIRKAGVEHKIDFIESPALPVLDNLLETHENEGTFDLKSMLTRITTGVYHERLLKLLRIGGMIVYDNSLWGGSVAISDESLVPERYRSNWRPTVEFNKFLVADSRVQLAHVSAGDGTTVCIRLH